MKVQGKKRLWSVFGAFVLAAATGLVLAAPAQAADGPNLPEQGDGGTITIHKLISPAEDPGLPHNGSELSDLAGMAVLGGVQFNITEITGIDLNTNAGWDAAKALSDEVLADGDASAVTSGMRGSSQSVTTDDDFGTATASGLWGVYLIEEIGGGENVVTRAAPFVVTVPLPTTVMVGGEEQQTWLTDVHVYPKNGVSSALKSVDDSGAYGLGDSVTWTIQGRVPSTIGTEPISSFTLTDTLDSRLTFDTSSVVAQMESRSRAAGDTVSLTENTGSGGDYDVAQVAVVSGGESLVQLTFTLNSQGRSKLIPGGFFKVTFDTVVTGVGDGTILNTTFANINGRDIQSEPAQTQWGMLEIFKYDAATSDDPETPGDERVGLEGAEFQIFPTETSSDPIEVNGVDTFTTGPDGTVTIDGLRVGTYWVEETQAPDFYQPTSGRIEVEITATTAVPEGCEPVDGQVTCDPVLVPVELDVANTKIPDWQLPLTGGTAFVAPMLGAGMLLAAVGVLLWAGKRRVRSRATSRV